MVAMVPGVHGPVAASFRIPGERRLDQCAAAGAMQIRADVVARPHHVVDLKILYVLFLAIVSDLPAPLIVAVIAPLHAEPGIRRAVIESASVGFDRVFRPRLIKRSSHPLVPLSPEDLLITTPAK